jgi:hypothetical protein
VERLQTEAADAEAARQEVAVALRAVHDLVQPVPVWLRGETSPLVGDVLSSRRPQSEAPPIVLDERTLHERGKW